jgi:hypothetical protein
MIYSQGQNSYLKFKIAYTIAGTSRVLKQSMIDQHFDIDATAFIRVEYPQLVKYPSATVEWGRHLDEKKSVSVLALLQEAGRVKGYNGNTGISIDYASWVLNPKFNFHGSGVILGVGPSALLVQYKRSKRDAGEDYSYSKALPGLSLSAETKRKKKKGFGVGLFAALNLHPSFDIKPIDVSSNSFSSYFTSRINPSGLNIELRFGF